MKIVKNEGSMEEYPLILRCDNLVMAIRKSSIIISQVLYENDEVCTFTGC